MKKIIEWIKTHKKAVIIMTSILGVTTVAGIIIYKLKLQPTRELIDATANVLETAEGIAEPVMDNVL